MCMCRYVFDGLSEDQAMDLLTLHGQDGTYLVTCDSEGSTWSFIVRQRWAPFGVCVLGDTAGYCGAGLLP